MPSNPDLGDVIIHNSLYTAHDYVRVGGSAATTYLVVLNDNTTDGVPDNHPESMPPEPNGQGEVNYYDTADRHKIRHWKRKLGWFVVEHVLQPDFHRGTGQTLPEPDYAMLYDFPKNYKLYVHRKGHRHDPREDAYLYGSRYVHVFRSPEEFAPHLKWLMDGSPLKPSGDPNCKCKYCDPTRKQREISAELHHKKKNPDNDRKGGGKPKDGGKRTRNGSSLTGDIPYKDYTKLNMGSTN